MSTSGGRNVNYLTGEFFPTYTGMKTLRDHQGGDNLDSDHGLHGDTI
jgi:hypothetical protein